jgi:cystathionine beta-lyase family protein involved in aluminum resistance
MEKLEAKQLVLNIPCGTFIAGIGCGISQKGGFASINDWVIQTYHQHAIPGVSRSADGVIQPSRAVLLLHGAIDAARKAAQGLRNQSRCGAACSTITIRVECDYAFTRYLENGEWEDRKGNPITGININPNDRDLCKFSETISVK